MLDNSELQHLNNNYYKTKDTIDQKYGFLVNISNNTDQKQNCNKTNSPVYFGNNVSTEV